MTRSEMIRTNVPMGPHLRDMLSVISLELRRPRQFLARVAIREFCERHGNRLAGYEGLGTAVWWERRIAAYHELLADSGNKQRLNVSSLDEEGYRIPVTRSNPDGEMGPSKE